MADGLEMPESNIIYNAHGKEYMTLPGSKSMACNKSNQVNVGDPIRSFFKKEVSADKYKREEAEKPIGKSDWP